jgi:hypothetical protein
MLHIGNKIVSRYWQIQKILAHHQSQQHWWKPVGTETSGWLTYCYVTPLVMMTAKLSA